MVKVALVGPLYNGLNKYLTPLASTLVNQGCNIDRIGFPDMNFNFVEIKSNVEDLVRKVIWNAYDVIHYNYGTYDAEQLIPLFLSYSPVPQILTLHSTQLDLFRKTGTPQMAAAINQRARTMDGYCFFTKYAEQLTNVGTVPHVVSWHPSCHEAIHVPLARKQSLLRNWGATESLHIVTVLGYPSHWKDSAPVLRAAKRLPNIQFIFGGPWWDQKLARESETVGDVPSNVKVISHELNEVETVTLIEAGIGLFPYREYPSFQGSGLLPDYLARGVTCVISNIPPLEEYAKNRSFLVDIDDEIALASTLELAVAFPHQLSDPDFSYNRHGEDILKLYLKVLNSKVKHENFALS